MVLTCTPPLSHEPPPDEQTISNLSSGCVGRVRLKGSPLLPAYRQLAWEMEGTERTAAAFSLPPSCIFVHNQKVSRPTVARKTLCGDWIFYDRFLVFVRQENVITFRSLNADMKKDKWYMQLDNVPFRNQPVVY